MRLAHNIPQVLQRTVALRSQMPGLGVALAGGQSGPAPHTADAARHFWREALLVAVKSVLAAWVDGSDIRKAKAAQAIRESYTQFVIDSGTAYTVTSINAIEGALEAGIWDRVFDTRNVTPRSAQEEDAYGRELDKGRLSFRPASPALEDDLARARKYLREWIATPYELGGKDRDGRDMHADGTKKTDEQIASRLERILGIQRGQLGDYNNAMRDAAEKLVPHLQRFVNEDAPQRNDEETGFPPYQRNQTETQRERTEDVFGPLPRRFQQKPSDFSNPEARLTSDEAKGLMAAILAEWTLVAVTAIRTGMPRLLAQGMEEIKKSVNWGDPQGSLV